MNNIQNYTPKDKSLIKSVNINRNYGLNSDYIEYHIYDLNNNLLYSNYNFSNYFTSIDSQIKSNDTANQLYITPSEDISNSGFHSGEFNITYNFLRKYFGTDFNVRFFIKEISSDRKELRLSSNEISNEVINLEFKKFIEEFNKLSYYKDFYLNFGNNLLIIGVNVALDNNTSPNSILIKLYEPLPSELDIKSTCWIVETIGESESFSVSFIPDEKTKEEFFLKGPNFNLDFLDKQNSSTEYFNYNQLYNSSLTSSAQQAMNLIKEKGIELSIDYTDYSNFIHFSSAEERLLNFYYKLSLIENYSNELNITTNSITGSTSSSYAVSSSISILQNNINNIIDRFDGYEYFLYYDSSSYSWPKSTNAKPYTLYSVTSSQALTWLGSSDNNNSYFGGQLLSASNYDNSNENYLINTIPGYLLEDPQNESYLIFLSMIGQHFDNVWIYSKAITDIYKANNNLYKGISKDLVSYALKSLGLKLYTNNFSSENLFQYLLGVTPSGNYLYPTSSFETLVTASIYNTNFYSTPLDELNKETYKRLYHNLPYLLKSKGTERGLRALISCFGIPDTILRISEFGGSDKESGSFEHYYNRFSYCLDNGLGGFVRVPWAPSYYKFIQTGNDGIVPDAIEFRFKPKFPINRNIQTLFQIGSGSSSQLGMTLRYNPISATGSFENYGNVDFVLYNSSNTSQYISCSVYLPVFDGNWWSLLVYRETGSLNKSLSSVNNTYKLFVKNSIYNGHDGEYIGYQASSSLYVTSSNYNLSWINYSTSSLLGALGGNGTLNGISTSSFSGSFQEYRNYVAGTNLTNNTSSITVSLPENSFNFHVMNPESIETNTLTSSYTDLIYRLPLGNNLYTYNHGLNPLYYSTHPAYSSSYQSIPSTGSFLMSAGFSISSLYGIAQYGTDIYGGISGSSGSIVISWGLVTGYPSSNSYKTNIEYYYINSPNTGIDKRITDKIRIYSPNMLSGSISESFTTTGSILSPYTSIQKNPEIALTPDMHTLEIALSPSNEISDDIVSQLGYFNIDDYIGNPEEETNINYPRLEELKKFYFKKYIRNYNLYDYIRLIKYFDNSLFKMIKDFVPGRSNISTGIVIKSHILERNKISRHIPEFTSLTYSQSLDIGNYSADDGGILNKFKNYIIGGNF